jgi:hypothetical protein
MSDRVSLRHRLIHSRRRSVALDPAEHRELSADLGGHFPLASVLICATGMMRASFGPVGPRDIMGARGAPKGITLRGGDR